MGFTNGEFPHQDIKEAGMLGLICTLNFIDSIQNVYNSCLTPNELEEGIFVENSMMFNILYLS